EPVMVGPGVKTSVRIRYDNPKDVGADRIANALAAYTKYGGPVVVIDFGTAVTYDAINAEGDYLGGAIAPGVEISLDALVSKTAPKFHLYVLDEGQSAGLPATGLETEPLTDSAKVEEPALILLRPGQKVPDRLAPIAVELPADASPAAARELVRVAMENVVLKRQVMQLEDEADRRHRQFRELNRIGIALSAEKDIARLQAFILTTMRQLTHADGASLWLKMEEDGVPKLFLASSQNHSLDKNTYQAFKVPVDDRTVVGYTVSMGTSQIYEDAYNPPPGKPVGGKSFDSQFGYRTKSMLTVPMRNYNNEVVGAVQLINAKRRFETRLTVDNVVTEVVSFQPDDLEMIESIASQAAVA